MDDGDGSVRGYFALAPTVIATNAALGETAPALLLAKMALCADLRGESPPVGPQLLLAAFETAKSAADLVGGRFLAVDTQHDRAHRFYVRNGFEPIEGNETSLIIKLSTIRKVLA